MVTAPVVTVFPTEEPDTMPQRAEEMTATFAGPPANRPAIQFASEIKKLEIPVLSKNAPKMIKTTMNFEQTLTGVEKIPSFV